VLAGNPQLSLQIPAQLTTTSDLILPLNRANEARYVGMTATALSANPLNLRASLTATLQPNRAGSTGYMIIPDTTFPVTVTIPTAEISAGMENVMLRAVNFAIAPESTRLSDADLTPYNAQLCVDVSGGGVNATYELDATLKNADFIPYSATTYAYTVNLRAEACDGIVIATIGEGEFGVDPLYIGFLDGDNASTISALGEYLPFTASLGLFVRRGESYTRYTGNLNDVPVITADSTAVTIGAYRDNAYAVLIAPQIIADGTSTATLAFNLSAMPSVDSTQSIRLPIYTGTSAQNNGAVSIPIQRASATLASITPRQMDNATFAVSFGSTLGDNRFDATAINANGWAVTLNLSHPERGLAWNIPLAFADNSYRATVPMPLAGTYDARVTVKTAQGDVTYPLTPTIVSPIRLVGVDDNPNAVEEREQAYIFTYEWRDDANARVTTFDNPPTVQLDVKKDDGGTHKPQQLIAPNDQNQYVYEVVFGLGQQGSYTIHATWTTRAPDNSVFTDSAILTASPLVVGDVRPFSMIVDGQQVQTYFTPILPLVNLGLRQERILVANIVLQGRDRRYPILDVFPSFGRESVTVRLTDGEGKCAPFTDAMCVLQADKWDFRTDAGVGRIEIRDVVDNTPYQIEVELSEELAVNPDDNFYLESNARTSRLPMQLRLNTLTFAVPIGYGVVVFIITSILYIIVRGAIIRRDSQAPLLVGYLRFEDASGKFVEWQADLNARKRNRVDIRRDSRLRAVNVRRLVIRAIKDKPNEVRVWVWWSPPRKPSTLLRRMLPLDHLWADVKRQLIKDTPEALFAGSTKAVYRHEIENVTTTTTKTRVYASLADMPMTAVASPKPNQDIPSQTSGTKRRPPTVTPKPPIMEQATTITEPPFTAQPPIMEQDTTVTQPPVNEQPPMDETPPVDVPPPPPVSDSKPTPKPKRRFSGDDDDDSFGA
jgi:hypothetical protein